MNQSRVVVVIPTFKEGGTIAEIIPHVLEQQERIAGHQVAVLIVDGMSTDGTVEYGSSLSHKDNRVHLLLVPQRGLGIALRRAYEHAITVLGADLIAQMDADFSHNPDLLPELLDAIDAGYDLAI